MKSIEELKMKYAIVKVINSNYFIHAEGFTDLADAKTAYHGLCQTLWNAPDVATAEVKIMDENLDCVEGYKEFIFHKDEEEEIPFNEPSEEEPVEDEPKEEPTEEPEKEAEE